MASTPDSHPDSLPPETPGSVEQVDELFDGRHGVEEVDSPMADPGSSGGTAGTAGDNKVQDELDR